MVSGLFESSWHVKLGPEERRELEAIPGAAPFEPMPGRPMTGFTLLPPVDRRRRRRRSATGSRRAVDYGATLPPKVPKAKSKAEAADGAGRPDSGGAPTPVDRERGAVDAARAGSNAPRRRQPIAAGRMFWFMRNRFDGS